MVKLAERHATPDATILGPTPAQHLATDSAADFGDAPVLARCVLWSPAWDRAALTELHRRLNGNRLIFVEPTAGLGRRRLAQRAGRRLWLRRHGHDYERDVPAELRSAGFMINTLDRFAVGPGSIQMYAYGEAVQA